MFVLHSSKPCGGRCVPTQGIKDINLSYAFYTLWEDEIPSQRKPVANHKHRPAEEPFFLCMVPVYFRFYQCYTDEINQRHDVCKRKRWREKEERVLCCFFSVLYLPVLLP